MREILFRGKHTHVLQANKHLPFFIIQTRPVPVAGKIPLLLYCDTGFEYPENIQMFYRTAKFLGIKPVLLRHPKGFLNLLLEERLKWPDMKNRWCTAYLKTGVTDKWIRANRQILGNRCLFISGERRDESRGRKNLPELEYHSTTLWTKRKGDFTCHWYRPCLDYEKGKMFEQGRKLHLEPHFCYEYLGRCSCMACMFMNEQHAIENMKRYPEQIQPFIQAEIKLSHTWKKGKGLEELWNQCHDIDDVQGENDSGEESSQTSLFDLPGMP